MSSQSAPTRTLPHQPSLAQLRKQAKELLKAFRASEPAAFDTLTFVIAGAYLLSPKARAWLKYEGQVGEAQDGSPQPEYAPGGLLDHVRERGPLHRATPGAS